MGLKGSTFLKVWFVIKIFLISVVAKAEQLPQQCEAALVSKVRNSAIERLQAAGVYESAVLAKLESDHVLKTLGDEKAACVVMADGLGMNLKTACVNAGQSVRSFLAKPYRKLLDIFRFVSTHGGMLFRKYISGQDMDAHAFRWSVVEELHKEGDFRGSFGHPVHEGMAEVMSPVIFNNALLATHKSQLKEIGQPLKLADGTEIPVEKISVGPMAGVSGMSFPQLSAQSHIALMYMHLKMAKELGVRQLLNSGEGGHGFHLAMLEGDAAAMKKNIIEWNLQNQQFTSGSWEEAKVNTFISHIMDARNELFKEFTKEDIEKALVVAQFGSALNGIRTDDGTNLVDFYKLKKVGESPFVAMIQFKLKQAAKRGAKVDPKKVTNIVAALREIARNKPFKSPEVNEEFASYENIATMVVATKLLTKKPVSLKFAVGDVKDSYEFLKFLKDADALPDHLQIEGRGEGFSPGSGNAPQGANTSLPANEAVIAIDAILRKLEVREKVYLEATGDVLLPAEAVEKMALGADGVTAGRLWLGMGLGCSQVRACANGNCPYGIAARSESVFAEGLDPVKIGPNGYQAAANWHKALSQTLAETGATDWRDLKAQAGMGATHPRLRKKKGLLMPSIKKFFGKDYIGEILSPVMTEAEVNRYVYGESLP